MFDFEPEISMELQKLNEKISFMYAENLYRSDNLIFAQKLTEAVENFLGERQLEVRSETTYCNGASLPGYLSHLGPEVIVDQVEAEIIADRLEDYRLKHCHEIMED